MQPSLIETSCSCVYPIQAQFTMTYHLNGRTSCIVCGGLVDRHGGPNSWLREFRAGTCLICIHFYLLTSC